MKCPVCGLKMVIHGRLSPLEDKLLDKLPSGKCSIPYYQCEKCKADVQSCFAYQRAIFKRKWYIFKDGRWHFLRNEEVFNPSKRVRNEMPNM